MGSTFFWAHGKLTCRPPTRINLVWNNNIHVDLSGDMCFDLVRFQEGGLLLCGTWARPTKKHLFCPKNTCFLLFLDLAHFLVRVSVCVVDLVLSCFERVVSVIERAVSATVELLNESQDMLDRVRLLFVRWMSNGNARSRSAMALSGLSQHAERNDARMLCALSAFLSPW